MEFQPVDSLKLPRFAGIPTFFRLPHIEDPRGLDVAIFGVPFDGGQSYRTGSRFAPAEVRRMSAAVIKPFHPSFNVSPYDVLKIADLGDSPINPLDPAVSRQLIQDTVAKIVDAGVLPVAVGGDHSISLPILRAAAKTHGPLGLIQVDSHVDTGDEYFGSKYGNGTPFRRAVEEGLIDPRKWAQIGIRGPVYGDEEFSFIREHGVRSLTMDEVSRNGLDWVAQQLVWLKDTKCYVTFDIDAIDIAFAPATTSPVPGGLTSREALVLMRHLVDFPSIVGFDLVEVQPMYDVASITSILASLLIFEFLCTRAVVRRDDGRRVR
ncbi:MAG TPA: agmatinase [bacterium]|nr:agmatinase [bacterium]